MDENFPKEVRALDNPACGIICDTRFFADDTTENELITIFSYSLAKRNDIPGSFRIHSIVHRWAREQLDSTKQCEAVLAAINLLADGCTYGSTKRTAELLGMALRVIPHIDACMQALKDIFEDDRWHRVSPKTLVTLADAYRYQAVIVMPRRFLNTRWMSRGRCFLSRTLACCFV